MLFDRIHDLDASAELELVAVEIGTVAALIDIVAQKAADIGLVEIVVGRVVDHMGSEEPSSEQLQPQQ